MKKISSAQVSNFQKKVWDFYRASGRHDLPWRPQGKKKLNSYFVAVSELMLQQTQVSRVIPKFKLWVDTFPDWNSLAQAPLSRVLAMWQGLGYARRAKFLHTIAQSVLKTKTKSLPKTIKELETLPGIGYYTARAIDICIYSITRSSRDKHSYGLYTSFFQNREGCIRSEYSFCRRANTRYKES